MLVVGRQINREWLRSGFRRKSSKSSGDIHLSENLDALKLNRTENWRQFLERITLRHILRERDGGREEEKDCNREASCDIFM
ncbi:hypothetical protein D3C87_2019530 [compost metagenome]